MDELSDKLGKILSDPDSMSMISSILSGLKSSPDEGSAEKDSRIDDKNDSSGTLPDGSLDLMLKIAPLLSSLKDEDDSTRLLMALRPYLRDERRKRLDEAKKILMIIKALPYIKDSGIL